SNSQAPGRCLWRHSLIIRSAARARKAIAGMPAITHQIIVCSVIIEKSIVLTFAVSTLQN
ncbi:MAG: hypothetical protein K2G94_04405, partial [Muribaculaceae bacterium]|nr:hypothetical protein [Muribaculaceae bacterium]